MEINDTRHFGEDILYRAVQHSLSEEEELFVDFHASQCSYCLDRLRTVGFLHGNFEKIFNSWSAINHQKVINNLLKCQNIEKTTSLDLHVVEKYSSLLEQIKNRSLIGISLLLDRTRRLASQISFSLPSGYSFVQSPVVSGVGKGQNDAIDEHKRMCGAWLLKGEVGNAIFELEQAALIDQRCVESDSATIFSKADGTIKVYSDAQTSKVWVKYWPINSSTKNCFAFIESLQSPDNSKYSLLKPVEGDIFLLAEFENVTDLQYKLFIDIHPEE